MSHLRPMRGEIGGEPEYEPDPRDCRHCGGSGITSCVCSACNGTGNATADRTSTQHNEANPCGRCCWPDQCVNGCQKATSAQPTTDPLKSEWSSGWQATGGTIEPSGVRTNIGECVPIDVDLGKEKKAYKAVSKE